MGSMEGGSLVVGVGEELVLWGDPMGLHGCGECGRFRFLGWRVLILGAGRQPGVLLGLVGGEGNVARGWP